MTLGKRIKRAREAIKPKRLTQEAVGIALGVSDKAVSAWERDQDAPTQDKFPKLAEVLQTTVAYLHGEAAEMVPSQAGEPGNAPERPRINHTVRNQTSGIIPAADLMGEVDLPVYSIVKGGGGALILENEPFTYARRPRRLLGIAKGYGVRVKGDSMAPEYNENDIAFVDPTLNATKDDPCVFQCLKEDGTVEVDMKYLDRAPDASETVYYVRTGPCAKKFRKFTIKKVEWQKCHVAVGKESGR